MLSTGRDEVLYGLPAKVRFCRLCVMTNQRPSSYPEFLHSPSRKTPTLHIDDDGVCDACRYAARKAEIDWGQRERELLELLDQHRSGGSRYDCIVPGSGGKDSGLAAHVLKHKYGMNPLTVTWPPFLYTDYGLQNFRNWLDIGGFDNVSFRPNGDVHRRLTRLALRTILHPFQTFILGQKNLAPKMALRFGIPLVFFGEPEAEYGSPIKETTTSLRDRSYFAADNFESLHLAGVPIRELIAEHGFKPVDLEPYLPPKPEELQSAHVEVHYLGYYLAWTPQESYYYAVQNAGFQARPFRTEGTYSKYNSIDDKIDDLHFYTTHIKFGVGRTSHDASQEVRNRHLTREEAVNLTLKFDGERPSRYTKDVLEALEMSEDELWELCDRARSPHLWENTADGWSLRHPPVHPWVD